MEITTEKVTLDGMTVTCIKSRDENSTFIISDKLDKVAQFMDEIKEVSDSSIKAGLELEFYVDNEEILNKILEEIAVKFTERIIINVGGSNLSNKDYSAFHIENDFSLDSDEGIEIITPIFDYSDMPFYLLNCLNIIEEHGYTNEKCGLHIHLSSKVLDEMDIVKFMVFAYYEDTVLKNYEDRNSMSRNLMEIFKNTKPDIFSGNIDKVGKNFNLRFITDVTGNHIEIRTLGGDGYYKDTHETFHQIHNIVKLYNIACDPILETQKYEDYLSSFIEENKDNFKDVINVDDIINKAKFLSKDKNSDFYINLQNLLDEKEGRRIIDTSKFDYNL